MPEREKKRRASDRPLARRIDNQNPRARRCSRQSCPPDAHPGQAHDLACAEELIQASDPDALIADKAFDADPFINALNERAITPVIPPKVNRKIQRLCDFALYCERNLIERFFNKLKHYRAVATRYDKLARNFLAGVQIACAMILLN